MDTVTDNEDEGKNAIEKEQYLEENSNPENISNPAEDSEENSDVIDLAGEKNSYAILSETKDISTLQCEDSLMPIQKYNDTACEKNVESNSVKTPENFSKVKGKGNQKEDTANGKKKVREGKQFSKVVIRRLPPSMTKEIFIDQVSPLPAYDYFYFVPVSMSSPGGFSRAYINFINQNDLFDFTRTFDNYVFVDSKGHEYPAIVEFAPYQRVPKMRSGRKKDSLMGTIESDPMYLTFKEQLQAEELENSRTTNKQHYFETEINESEEVVTTPLLEFLKARRAEKDRIREERREDRKRKEAERKLLKQKIKDKPQEEEIDIKVLPKDKKDITKERDIKRIKVKDKEERFAKPENRTREFKNKGGKSYREERLKQAEKREEKKKKENEEVKEVKNDAILDDEVKEEEKYWSDKKKWKYGSGDSKGSRTFSRRRDEKKKELFDRKRGSGKPFRSRKGSGESMDETPKKEKGDNTTESSQKTPRINASDKFEIKDSPNVLKKVKASTSPQEEEMSNNNPDNGSTSILKSIKENNSSKTKEKDADLIKECDKNEKEYSTGEINKKERLQKESSVDSEEGGKTSKDPRAERRIRNKDRPSIEIYRPGMGKFSRQRLEKEKTLGSTDESPSHSPSPTPNNNNNKSNLN